MKLLANMKTPIVLILFGACLFFACRGDRTASETMDRAEILLKAHPDSAYSLLEGMETPDLLDDRQFARWCMLHSRAAEKLFKKSLYVEQLERAFGWYKKHGTAEEQAWIGLYLGNSYAEDKLFIPATHAYSCALELAKDKRLYNVAGYICSYMSDLYTYTGQFSEERRKVEEAAAFFEKAGNIRSYAFALRDVAKTWVFDDSLSLALDYMLKADSIVTGLRDSVGMSSIYNGLGNIYGKIHDLEKARIYFDKNLTYDTADQAPTYLALSTMYYNNDFIDSARHYQMKVIGPTFNPYTLVDRLYLGYLIEKEAGDMEKSFGYLEKYMEAKDSLYNKQKQVDIIDAEKRHNVVTIVGQNKKLVMEKRLMFAIAVIASLLLVVGYQLKDRKRLLEINRKQQLLKEEEDRHRKQELEQENRLQMLTEEMEKKAAAHEDTGEYKKEILALRFEKLNQSAFIREIKGKCQKVRPGERQKLTDEEWADIIRFINTIFPNVALFMKDNTFGLTKAEMRVCYLSFFSLSINEEAILSGVHIDSANKSRSRTRQKLCPGQKYIDINDEVVQKGW